MDISWGYHSIQVSWGHLSIQVGRYDLYWDQYQGEFVICKGMETLVHWIRTEKDGWVKAVD